MEVKINKEIRNYTETIFFGLSLRQFIFSVLGCICSVIIFMSLKDKIHMEILSWLSMIGTLPFALLGFLKYNGMTAEQAIVAWIKANILMPKCLTFRPKNYYEQFINEKIRGEKI